MQANILDVAARPFKQKTRMDDVIDCLSVDRLFRTVDGMQQHV